MGDSSRVDETRYDLARNRARGLLTLTHQRPPVDVQAISDLAGIPVVERALPDGTRATIGDIAGRRSIILNRRWRFSSENERRWVLAEELGHVLMGHKLVESTEPGRLSWVSCREALLQDPMDITRQKRKARAMEDEYLFATE